MTTIRQVTVCDDPAWGCWPASPVSDYTAVNESIHIEHYGDITVDNRILPAYRCIDETDKTLPITYPWIDNTRRPSASAMRRMVALLAEAAETSDVIVWDHAKNCWPEVARAIPGLFKLSILPFADDCPSSTELKTLPVVRHFDAVLHFMDVWCLATGERVADVYRTASPSIRCYHAPSNESPGLMEWIASSGFDVSAKAAAIRAGVLPDVPHAFVGDLGGGWRKELLSGLADVLKPPSAFYGVDQRDGILRGRTVVMPMGDSVPVYSPTCGSPCAELYARTLFGVNPQASSLFNTRLMDLWRCGVVQLIHDPHGELAGHGWMPWTHYLPFDGTAADALFVMAKAKQDLAALASIIEIGAATVAAIPRRGAVMHQIYRDWLAGEIGR